MKKQKKEIYSNLFKLNNNGWGLQVMMLFILVLMIALVIVYIMVNRNFSDIVGYDYKSEETKVIVALKKYYKNNDIKINNGEEKIVSTKKLKEEKLLTDFNKCSGYGLLKNKNGKIIYDAYIRCDKYITDGYINYLDEY